MSKRNEHGVVLAMAVPHPEEDRARRGEHVTVFWRGPAAPGQWVEQQRDAARFADAALARHTHQVFGSRRPPTVQFDPVLWTPPALHARNGGPRSDIIAEAPAGGAPAGAAAAVAEQGDLFEGAR